MSGPRLISAKRLQDRILAQANNLTCKNIELARQGKYNKKLEAEVLELMLIHEFIPYWSIEIVKQKECYLNEKFNV